MKRILITGATGFIGSHLAHRMVKEGFEVGIIKRESSDVWRIRDILGKIKAYDADLKDTAAVSRAVSDFRPGALFHLATYYAVNHKPEEIPLMVGTNILGAINLLEASRESGTKLFVNTSSCFTYKQSKQQIKEDAELDPVNLYALTKIHAEEACSFYTDKYGLKTVTLRLFPPYGPVDNERKLIPYVIRSLLANEKPRLTTGKQKWDFVYVDDIVDAYIRLLSADLPDRHEAFNIGTGNAVSIRDVVSMIKDIAGSNSELEWGSVPHRENEVWFCCADTSKTEKGLNWKPKTDLRTGLENTVRWVRGD